MLIIHGVPISIHVRKVIVTALEKALEHRVEVVFPFDPPAGWPALSPTGKIPVLTDGDFHLADSSVIVAYLERKSPRPSVYPADPREFGRALWFEEYVDGQIAPEVIGLFHQKVLGPMLHGAVPDRAVIDRVIGESLPPRLDYLERSLDGDWLAGERASIADFATASNLTVFHYLGFTLDGERHPKLQAHFARTLQRDSFRTALAAEQPFAEKMGLNRDFLRSIDSPSPGR